MSSRQRVLIVDDHRIFVQLLSTALAAETDLEPIGVAYDAQRGLQMTRELQPDLVVLDVRLGDGDGVAVARELSEEFPELKVVVLTGFADAPLVRRASESGACALLTKDGDLTLLLQTLRSARRGSFVSDVEAGRPAGDPGALLSDAGLSPQSGALLRLLAAGFDVRDVARELETSRAEAQGLIDCLVADLHADGTADAVEIAVRRGILKVGHG